MNNGSSLGRVVVVVQQLLIYRPSDVSAALDIPMPGGILSGYLTTIFVPFRSKPFDKRKGS